METTLNIVSIIIIVFGILQIILFFKVWGMTNDVRDMKIIMEKLIRNKGKLTNERSSKNDREHISTDNIERDFKIDDLVVELKNERQLKISDITSDGRYKCRNANGISSAGIFNRDEIELYDKYWHKSN